MMIRTPLGLLLMLVLAAPGAGQFGEVLYRSAEDLTEPLTLKVSTDHVNAFLVIEGLIDEESDVLVHLGSQNLGTLRQYMVSKVLARLHVPLLEGLVGRIEVQGVMPLRLEPTGKGAARITRVIIEPAARLRVRLQDPETRMEMPCVLSITSLDGRELPNFPNSARLACVGHSYLLRSGNRLVLLPVGVRVDLSAYSHPFREPAESFVRMKAGQRTMLVLRAGQDRTPENAEFLDGVGDWRKYDPQLATLVRRCMGTHRVSVLAAQYSARSAELDTRSWEKRLLNGDLLAPVLTLELGDEGALPSARALRTLQLRTGRKLHTNGPLLEVQPLVRDPRSYLVETQVRVDPRGTTGRLRVISEFEHLLDVDIVDVRRVPMELKVAPGDRVLFIYEERPGVGQAPKLQPARAYMAVRAP